MSTEGTVEPMTRAQSREACYAVRDAFYACLDANHDSAAACTSQLEAYKAGCMRSWVSSGVVMGAARGVQPCLGQ